MDETLNELGQEWRTLIEYKEGSDNISKHELMKSFEAVHPKIYKNGLSLLCIDTLVSVLEKLAENNDNPDLSLEVLKNLIPNEKLTNEFSHRLILWFLSSSYQSTSANSFFTYWLLVCIKIGVINKEFVQNNYFKPLMFSFLKNVSDDALSHLLKFLSKNDSITINLLSQIVQIYNREEDTKKKKQLAVLLKYYFQILPAYTENHANFKCKKVNAPSALALKDKSLAKVIDRIISINSAKESKLNLIKIIHSLNEEETQVASSYYFGLSPAYNSNSEGVRLSTLTGFQDIVKFYQGIVPPTNILAVLQYKCGHIYVRFSSPAWVAMLEEQVRLILNGILNNSLHPIIIHDKFLSALVAVQTVGSESLPSVSEFLKQYIIKWDTVKYRSEIVQLIPWLHFTSVKDLKDTMGSLYTVFATADLNCRLLLLNALIELYINMMIAVNQRIANCSLKHYEPPNWMKNKPHEFFALYLEILGKFIQTGLLFHDSSPAFLSQTILGYYKIFMVESEFNFKVLNETPTRIFTVLPTSVVLLCHTSTCITVLTCLVTILSEYWNAQETIIANLKQEFYETYSLNNQFIGKYTADTIKILLGGVDSIPEDLLMGQIMKSSDKESYQKMFSQTKNLLSVTKNFATSHIVYELTRKMKINLSSIQPEKYMDLLEYFAPKTSTMMSNLISNLEARPDTSEVADENIEASGH